MTKKGHQEFSTPKKVIQKFGPRNFFPSPQTRRQVSTYALHCQWKNETARERTGHQDFYAVAKKMKLL